MAEIIRCLEEPRRRIDGQVYEARVEADRILAKARAAADDLLRSAQAEAARVRETARLAGVDEGREQVRSSLARAAAERDRILASAERDVVRLALGVAATVLRREAERGPEVAVEMARRALAEARARSCVTVRLHPADVDAVRAREDGLAAVLPRGAGIAWIADPCVDRGGAVVETETGTIDARVESQLASVARRLEAAQP